MQDSSFFFFLTYAPCLAWSPTRGSHDLEIKAEQRSRSDPQTSGVPKIDSYLY